MATTTPDNLRTPDPGDPYNLVPDLQTLAQDVQDALIQRGNFFRGTAADRVAFLPTAIPGMVWQDTDGIGMLWKRGASEWVPAVWRWSGSSSNRTSFTQAPNGFEWFDTTLGVSFLFLGGSWVGSGWTSITPTSPWVPDGSIPPRYKVSDGVAYFRGRVSGSLAAGTIFTLPDGVRPTELSFYVLERGSATSLSRVTVGTDGVVSHSSTTASAAGNGLSLNGISFPVN